MWFVFPQISGLGRSDTAQFYAIADQKEASEFLGHSLLGPRLENVTRAMLTWAGLRSAEAILGPVDAMKLRSSMTLFEAASDQPAVFAETLEAFYAGQRDPMTLELLG